MAKMTFFIIAIIIFSMVFVGGFGALMASIDANYNVTGYNASKLSQYNKLSDVSDNLNAIQNKTLNARSQSGAFDVLGEFFKSGYEAMKLTFNSFGIFYEQADLAFEEVEIQNSNMFKVGIMSIVLIIIIIGIILKVVLKTDV